MHVSDVQKAIQYNEFFMSGRGKGHRGLGATSQVDSVLLGRDIDNSGEDAHKQFMSTFVGYAGVKSGEKPSERPFRKPCYAMKSTLDSVIWGRDFDSSGSDPHQQFVETYTGHAGCQAGDKPTRPFRKPICSLKSTMDTVVLGRDLDGSGEVAMSPLSNLTDGGAGVASGNRPDRPFRKPGCSMQGVVDQMIWGHDLDKSGENPHSAMMASFGDHAGMKSGHATNINTGFRERPFRKNGLTHRDVTGDLIRGKDFDYTPHHEFLDKFSDHAGGMSIGRRERKRLQQEEGMAPKSARAVMMSTPPCSMRRSSPELLLLRPSGPEPRAAGVASPRPPQPSDPGAYAALEAASGAGGSSSPGATMTTTKRRHLVAPWDPKDDQDLPPQLRRSRSQPANIVAAAAAGPRGGWASDFEGSPGSCGSPGSPGSPGGGGGDGRRAVGFDFRPDVRGSGASDDCGAWSPGAGGGRGGGGGGGFRVSLAASDVSTISSASGAGAIGGGRRFPARSSPRCDGGPTSSAPALPASPLSSPGGARRPSSGGCSSSSGASTSRPRWR